MTKPEWGVKRTCKKCSASFYDMLKNPITCPKCAHVHNSDDFIPRYSKNSDKNEARHDKPAKEISSLDISIVDEIDDPLIEDDNDFDDDVKHVERDQDHEEL